MADPGQLRLLALIEQHGSLTAAARALGLTPAAVTQQVTRAERDFHVPLVLRGPRGATLTPAGALLAGHGRVVDQQAGEASARLAALLGHLCLRLRVGAFHGAALRLLPPALTALRHRHPDADVTVQEVLSERGIEEITEDRLDLAVIASWEEPPVAPPHVTVHPLLRDPMVVVLPDDHPLTARHPPGAVLALEDLRDESWVTILAGHAARQQFDAAVRAAGFTPRIRFQTASYDVAQALVGTGIGVALVSRLALTGTPGTTHREIRPRLQRRLHAVSRTDTALTPLTDVFLTLLRDVATDIGAGDGAGDGTGPRRRR